MELRNNIISLVRLGFLPPDMKYEDLKRTLIYRLWEKFSFVCAYASYESLTPPKIRCKKINMECNFELCPILRSAIDDYERKQKLSKIRD